LREKRQSAIYIDMITPEQCRAARGLLGWTQAQLSERASVGVVTVRNFEGLRSTPMRGTLTLLQQALETAGVDFIPENGGGVGVRLRAPLASSAWR
jgi:transcriptional regulator with XRE-family HTH domain